MKDREGTDRQRQNYEGQRGDGQTETESIMRDREGTDRQTETEL